MWLKSTNQKKKLGVKKKQTKKTQKIMEKRGSNAKPQPRKERRGGIACSQNDLLSATEMKR